MKHFSSDEIVFLSAKRTPFGSFGGSLKNVSAIDLGVISSKAAIIEAKINATQIDQVIFGNVMHTSIDAIYFARHIGLKVGIPEDKTALTLNRICGSGFQSIIAGAEQILLGLAQCVLVGGSESMSQSPHIIRGARWGIPLAKSTLEDSLWEGLYDPYAKMSMGLTAEKVGKLYNLTQNQVDEFSIRSQKNYLNAKNRNSFINELTPVEFDRKKGKILTLDEHPRPNTSMEILRKLPKVFKKDGLIHAGAASGICDGAASLIMCSKSFAKKNKLNPIGKFINFGIAGCDPTVMGLGPIPATNMCLKRAETNISNIDIIEINEAFAPQTLAVQKELKIPTDKLNIDGGAIALGHPLAASGSRIITHLLHSLSENNMRYGLGSACIGGGQGISIIIEREE